MSGTPTRPIRELSAEALQQAGGGTAAKCTNNLKQLALAAH